MIATKNYIPKIVTGLAVGLACGTTAFSQSSDALLDKLVEKGILSVKEANTLREETDKDFTKAYSIKSGMPDWVSSLKLNGDFRGRYDQISTSGDALNRERLRYRLRLGATAAMSDNFEVGLRLASGDSDNKVSAFNSGNPGIGAGSPLSANSTMNNDANRKGIFVDLAYAKWTPIPGGEVQFGKMQDLFWMSDMVLDPDYNPEGGQERYAWAMNDKNTLSFTSGQWVIAENGFKTDAYLFLNQIDWAAKWTPKFSTRAGVGIYNFLNQKAIPGSLETYLGGFQNGTPAVGANAQQFNPIIARAEATYLLASFPLFSGEFPITPMVEYANNPGANGKLANGNDQPYDGKQNEAYNLGITFGSAKAKGNWQISYNYKNIETASLWHGINDDDFGFNGHGGTDVRGHQISAAYHVFNPLTLGVRYFKTEQINNTAAKPNNQDRFFVDLMLAF